MANDYVYMVCHCRKHFRLFGYYPSLGIQTSGVEHLARFEKWVFEHRFCCDESVEFASDLDRDPRFRLLTDSMMADEREKKEKRSEGESDEDQ